MKKRLILSFGAFASFATLTAQDLTTGAGAIDTAAGQVGGFYAPVSKLVFAIAGIIALVGAIRIFLAWNSGDRDIGKMVVGWAGACIFLVAVGAIITAFFGTV